MPLQKEGEEMQAMRPKSNDLDRFWETCAYSPDNLAVLLDRRDAAQEQRPQV
jgi:hypothetical protein